MFDRTTNPFSEGKVKKAVAAFDGMTNPFSEGKKRKTVAVFGKSYIPVFREESVQT